MAEFHTDVGSKRRLPVWMLGVHAADKLKKSENEDENRTSFEQQSSIQVASPKEKPIIRRIENKLSTNGKVASEVDSGLLVHTGKPGRCKGVGTIAQKQADPKKQKLMKYGRESSEEIETNVLAYENGAPKADSGTLVRCETQRRTGKLASRDGNPNTSITSSSEVGERTKKAKTKFMEDKRTGWKRTAPKKQKMKNCETESIEDVNAPSPIEGSEDGELTVEDLLSMAEEYVKASKEKECQQTEMAEPKSRTQLLGMNISNNESGGSLQETGSIQEISTCTATGPIPDIIENKRNGKEILSSGVTITASRTGDPAQDMLDLLLGPLLKKTQTEQRTLDLLKRGIIIARDSSKDVTSQVGMGQEAPLTKKKSSLKDKVAMFLD